MEVSHLAFCPSKIQNADGGSMPKDRDAKFDGTVADLSGMLCPPGTIVGSMILTSPRPGASQI
jgi:hypothetical protein